MVEGTASTGRVAPDLPQYAANVLDQCKWDMEESVPKNVALNFEKRHFAWGTPLFQTAAKSAIEASMVRLRFEKDFDKAVAAQRWAAEFCDRWVARYLESIREWKAGGIDLGKEGQMPLAVLDLPLFCCLLAGDWPLAQRAASWTQEPEVVAGKQLDDALTALYANLVLDDRKRFEAVDINAKTPGKERAETVPGDGPGHHGSRSGEARLLA